MNQEYITVSGARQNNLKDLHVRLPVNKMIVVTGVSGSGKSSIAFDTIYSEGQRRYVETFSAYTRQFLDRMDKPSVDSITGIPPAIAIDQTNPVRTSRSTVGTMTELNDHLKLLFARASRLICRSCGREVIRETPEQVWTDLKRRLRHMGKKISASADEVRLIVTFPVEVPHNFTKEEVLDLLAGQGYRRIHNEKAKTLHVVQDRLKLSSKSKPRFIEDMEAAFLHGRGRADIRLIGDEDTEEHVFNYSTGLHCARCDITYRDPVPNLFSFNSPMGACDTCRGFGRTIGIDYDLVIPDKKKTIREGPVKPWQSKSYRICRKELMDFARKRKIPLDVPWNELSDEIRQWVIEGEGEFDEGVWYGIRRFFNWLETKSYKMHIRVFLSKYRTYRRCADCGGARLKEESLCWRLGRGRGYSIHELMLLPIGDLGLFFDELAVTEKTTEAVSGLLDEIRSRIGYLNDVGLSYLNLDRQSRTLSGGEVQRINLTTALGTSLVNTLFVLDEPSIGLHSRDIRRLISILKKLKEAGNTLLIVEHDPELITAADLVLDMGPAAGSGGGEIVFFGPYNELVNYGPSVTAAYLRGERQVFDAAAESGKRPEKENVLCIRGAEEHNLKKIDVKIPLSAFVCLSGVSGSGKSTLMETVLYRAVKKIKGRPVDSPGRYAEILGADLIDDVVLVDQSPIGKTTRSNSASYVGALDGIRKVFAEQPLSKQRGFTAGTFSFNSKKGQCPFCSGSGFEHIEMQFLSDVYIRCPECGGKRYRPEVLEIRLSPGAKSIADVLEMTVADACAYFDGDERILNKLKPLQAVGLDYISLGQPVPTLSGGEAQRLKLAGHLSEARKSKKKNERLLFLFDEPTTGLHFDDIAVLLKALRALCDAGHSLLVIEHNLDLLLAADHIIDLGPEGGETGGSVVCTGSPAELMKCRESHTGSALKTRQRRLSAARQKSGQSSDTPAEKKLSPASRSSSSGIREGSVHSGKNTNHAVRIMQAREHNLRGIDVHIPVDTFSVITGVSGSGKSTVAFDILFAEGQRRYLESLNAYARQFVQPASRPDVDGLSGIPPTVAIEQRNSRGGRKSTVATVTELYHYIRLLFVKLGVQYCPRCTVEISAQSPQQISERIAKQYRNKSVLILAPLVIGRKGYYTDLAKWAAKKGYPELRVDGRMLPTEQWPRLDRYREHNIELPVAELSLSRAGSGELDEAVGRALSFGGGFLAAAAEGGSRDPVLFSVNRSCPSCGTSFQELDPRLFSFNSKHGWCPECFGTGEQISGFDEEQTGEESKWLSAGEGPRVCPACGGKRLRPEALSVFFHGISIDRLTSFTVDEATAYFKSLKLASREKSIARDILQELISRLSFLDQVGLSYLSLDRAAPTLSGGEAQRIRLASQLGSNLRGVCYILDEPTIGLHPRDHRRLLSTLRDLKDRGNTVVVVEHDEETIRQAEYVIDLGPGGGKKGGELIFSGRLKELIKSKDSVTARFLREPLAHPFLADKGKVTVAETEHLVLRGASVHNLKNITVEMPLGGVVCVTGVSGSGKSSLVRDVLFENMKLLLSRKAGPKQQKVLRGCTEIEGWKRIQRVLEVDQTPIGKTPRSCPATYVGLWDEVRKLFSELPEARVRGYGPGRFSFNVEGGRCEECGGQGQKKIEMNFLPDVSVLCESCGGRRFNEETCGVRFKEKSIAEVLAMDVDEAVAFFSAQPKIYRPLKFMQDLGLGYLTLGQQSPSLSGGEAQRIKLVTELAKSGPASLYILDEPTIGLHMADVEKLIVVLHRLAEAGNTVVVIEHNLDLIAEADWVIDLGPEGGEAGGSIVAQGSPIKLAADGSAGSYTAEYLKPLFKRSRRR